MIYVVHEPIDDKQAVMYIWPPADFCSSGLDHVVPIHPIFESCHLKANVAQWWNGHSSSHLPVLIHSANVCGRLRCFCPSIELKEKNMSEMLQFSPLGTPFSKVHGSTHISK